MATEKREAPLATQSAGRACSIRKRQASLFTTGPSPQHGIPGISPYYTTTLGAAYLGNSRDVMAAILFAFLFVVVILAAATLIFSRRNFK